MTAQVIPSPMAILWNPLPFQILPKALVKAQNPVTTLSSPPDLLQDPSNRQGVDPTTEWMGTTVFNVA